MEDRWERGGLAVVGAFADTMFDRSANEIVAEFVRSKIRATVVDPDVAEALSPRGYAIGSKRVCVDTGYYATYNRDHVRLVDVRETPIEEFNPAGVRTTAQTFAFDSIVFATGFDAISGALLAIDIRGRGGRTLREEWAAGPAAYLGVAAAGFPNLFLVTGPGSPSVLSNMVVSIEQHVEWIADCLVFARAEGLRHGRGGRRRPGPVDGSGGHGGEPDGVADGRLLVHRGQHSRKGPQLPHLPRRGRYVPPDLRRRGVQRL